MSQQATESARWDLIVLGGDLEGLAAAAEAARGGLRTLLVTRDEAGGTARANPVPSSWR